MEADDWFRCVFVTLPEPPNAQLQLQRILIRVRAERAHTIAILCQLQRWLGRWRE
jgi:hypothetical protein